MIKNSLERRVALLEKQMGDLRALLTEPSKPKDWRSMIGCFADDPGMMEIFEEGRKIREKERERARRPTRQTRKQVKK